MTKLQASNPALGYAGAATAYHHIIRKPIGLTSAPPKYDLILRIPIGGYLDMLHMNLAEKQSCHLLTKSEAAHIIADVLSARGIPFLFATGFGEHNASVEKYPGAVTIEKSFNREALLNGLLASLSIENEAA